MIWFALAPFICAAIVLALWLLAAFAAGARADEAGENARRQLGEGAKRFDPVPRAGVPQDALWQPEHSHRSPLSGRRPARVDLGIFASDKPFHRGSIIGDD